MVYIYVKQQYSTLSTKVHLLPTPVERKRHLVTSLGDVTWKRREEEEEAPPM